MKQLQNQLGHVTLIEWSWEHRFKKQKQSDPSIFRGEWGSQTVGHSSTLLTDCHPSKTLLMNAFAQTHTHTVCPQLLGPQADPWVLPPRWIKVQQPWRGPSRSHSKLPASSSTCPSQTRPPWPARESIGHKPPPRSSSRHTWGRHSASAGGRSSGWAGGSPSPGRWWSWRCGLAGCSLLLLRCLPPTVT